MLALVAVALVATGCSGDRPDLVVVTPPSTPTPPPAYDGTLEPAAAVMAIVPEDATVLEVTDFDQVRYALGYGELTSDSDKAVTDRFARDASRDAALLSDGMLRGSGYESRYGFSQDDVSWEAHFDGPSGEGYVIAFRDDLDMAGVQRAAAADDGPLTGAVVVVSEHLAALGATREPDRSWAADAELTALVGTTAGATYVSRECVDATDALPADDTAGDAVDGLDPLGPFSMAFGGELVTADLGGARSDAFERARLTDPTFAEGYADAVADPSGGRIGYSLADAPEAARLAQRRELPFAVCA